jgi:hypothetical protein
VAARKLVAAMGYGQSRNNIFKWTSYLKFLSDLREKGAIPFLLSRTGEFKNYFFQRAMGLDILLSWNSVYDLPLQQLRLRVITEEADDFSGKAISKNSGYIIGLMLHRICIGVITSASGTKIQGSEMSFWPIVA